MCGITGFVNFSGHERYEAQARVRRMAGTIAHRGPDREGFYVDDFAALEHRRLAFIDVAGRPATYGVYSKPAVRPERDYCRCVGAASCSTNMAGASGRVS